MNRELRVAFAGDRDISVWVLRFLRDQGVRPLALCVSAPDRASHAAELKQLCDFLAPEYILTGKAFRSPAGMELLRSLNLDYIIGVHFPYIVPAGVLSIPSRGVLNLHPAFLPFNRGWHTPSWAILEDTPIGATLHFMDEGVDTGDIVYQQQLQISPGDTADSLYRRLKKLEFETFVTAWPWLAHDDYVPQPQNPHSGTARKRQELFADSVQQIDLQERVTAGDLLRKLRALTTNDPAEAAYFEVQGRRYRLQVTITEEVPST